MEVKILAKEGDINKAEQKSLEIENKALKEV